MVAVQFVLEHCAFIKNTVEQCLTSIKSVMDPSDDRY